MAAIASLKQQMPESPAPARQHSLMLEQIANFIAATTSDAILCADPEGRISFWNASAEALLGYSSDEAIGQSLTLIIPQHLRSQHGRGFARVQDGAAPVLAGRVVEVPARHKSGQEIPVELSLAMWPNSVGPGLCVGAIIRDVTERKEAQARIAHMAFHDALTDLPNRSHFIDGLRKAIDDAERRSENAAVLCLDLDQFKIVNDTLGHPVGDALLKEVAARLRVCAGDTVARLGGDEFAFVRTQLHGPQEAGALASRIVEALGKPFRIQDHDIVVGASVGIAVFPDDGASADQLLKNADIALYRAKADGRGRHCFFEAAMHARVQARHAMELDLRRALEAGEFELHYQPVVNLQRGTVSGFEALLRWRHPQRGMVPPMDFIPLAEEIGLIVPLGEWVVRQACAQAALWPERISVAVNLSPAQFKSRHLVQTIVSALSQSGLAADRLELEITETVLLADAEATVRVLHQLRSLGVRISLDDFGTGYSSLSYLRSFPFDKIKIDRSFVQDLDRRGDCRAIVRAVTALGSSLGMTTTAEGVETGEQLEQLQSEGCTEVQGFYFSAAIPGADVTRFFSRAGSR